VLLSVAACNQVGHVMCALHLQAFWAFWLIGILQGESAQKVPLYWLANAADLGRNMLLYLPRSSVIMDCHLQC
jgi:hypothetical protein